MLPNQVHSHSMDQLKISIEHEGFGARLMVGLVTCA